MSDTPIRELLWKLDDPLRREADAAYAASQDTFPKVGDNFREVRRSTVMSMAGFMDKFADLPPRPDTDFTSHADHQNYLHGRNQSA